MYGLHTNKRESTVFLLGSTIRVSTPQGWQVFDYPNSTVAFDAYRKVLKFR